MRCRMAAETETKRTDLQRKLMGDAPKLAALLQRTAMIQKEVEAALSSANGREINIIGEINMVLGTT
jgi:CDK5 regulatory subunit-associated protein 3